MHLLLLFILAAMANAQARSKSLNLASGPSGLHERSLSRFPSRHYDWVLSSGIVGPQYLNPDLTVKRLKKLLESHGTFKPEGSNLLFSFFDGGNIKFTHENGRVTEMNFLYNNYGVKNAVKSKFQRIISNRPTSDAVLRRNPYFDDEIEVSSTLVGTAEPVRPSRVKLCELFVPSTGVSFLLDRHGDHTKYDFVLDILALKRVDWFGIEMIPHTMQKDVTDFINEPEASEKYKSARSKLIEYFSNHWEDKFSGRQQNGTDNPYFTLLETARSRKVQVFALDVEPDYYKSNPQSSPLAFGTRNRVWASQLPRDGNGLVFGGMAHFESPPKASVQDFYSRRAPGRPLTLVESDGACSLSQAQRSTCESDLTKLKLEKRCESLDEFRCIRRNIAFLSGSCAAALGLDSEDDQDRRRQSPAI